MKARRVLEEIEMKTIEPVKALVKAPIKAPAKATIRRPKPKAAPFNILDPFGLAKLFAPPPPPKKPVAKPTPPVKDT